MKIKLSLDILVELVLIFSFGKIWFCFGLLNIIYNTVLSFYRLKKLPKKIHPKEFETEILMISFGSNKLSFKILFLVYFWLCYASLIIGFLFL